MPVTGIKYKEPDNVAFTQAPGLVQAGFWSLYHEAVPSFKAELQNI
jgi:hypothetical protein